MTPQEQRIALAESDGWTHLRYVVRTLWGTSPGFNKPDWHAGCVGDSYNIPDYLNDLNAINHLIVSKILGNEELEKRFVVELNLILDRKADDETIAICEYEMAQITASAAELSEALLRTIGKWKD
jgi:hypothetical protein